MAREVFINHANNNASVAGEVCALQPGAAEIIVVPNWFEERNQKAPTGKN